MTVTGSVQIGDVSRLPDQGVWYTKTDSGHGQPECDKDLSCSQAFALEDALGSDTLVFALWKLGVRIGVVRFIQVDRSLTLTRAGSSVDELDRDLLSAFHVLREQSEDSLETVNASDLIAFYAKLLFEGDTTYKDKSLPIGMSVDSVKKAIVLWADKHGCTAVKLAEKSILGMTTDTVTAYMHILVGEGSITDTASLFPPPPVRVVAEIAVASDLVQGEGNVAVTGSFAWRKQSIVTRTLVEIKTEKGDEDSIVPAYKAVLNPTSGAWSLTDNMSLRAATSARLGIHTLVVTVTDDSGNSATSRTRFNVVRGDSIPPTVAFTSPTEDTVVANSVSRILLKVEASDDKSVATVQIGKVVHTVPPYADSMDLAVGRNIFVVQATDPAGNASFDTIVVTRTKAEAGDSTKPVVQFTEPPRDTSVPFTVENLELRWTVSDEVGVVNASLNDSAVAVTAGACSRSVGLLVGSNDFEAKAYDAAGNVGKQTIRITRRRDSLPPTLAITSPSEDTTVPNNTTSILVKATVLDAESGLKGFTIGGQDARDTRSAIVDLEVGANLIVVVATDSASNQKRDSVVVVRAAVKPSHDLDSGHFVRYWKPLHLTAPGADSIQWSQDGKTWTTYKDSVRVDCDSCRILSRSWPGPSAVDSTGMFWIRKVKAVAAGGYHSMFLMQDGTVWAAGKNIEGRLGDGTKEMRAVPVPVLLNGHQLTNVVSVYGGGSHSLYLRGDGTLWGAGVYFGDPDNRSTVPIQIMENISDVSTWYSIVGLHRDGTVSVFGSNDYGELGLDDSTPQYAPVKLAYGSLPVTGIRLVSTGISGISVYSTREGFMSGGMQDTLWTSLHPNPVNGLDGDIEMIRHGPKYLEPPMVQTSVGTIWQISWQDQIGASSASLVASGAVDFCLGRHFTAILKVDRSVWVKGDNEQGSVGSGSSVYPTDTTIFVKSDLQSRVSQFAAGYTFIVTLTEEGEVLAWGANEFGQLGIGNTFDQSKPVQVNF